MDTAISIHQILTDKFQLDGFRKGQESILQSVMAAKDAMAVMPTGGGKSLCYQLPSIALDGLVIVVSPLVALMKDQVESLHRLGLPAGCLHAGQSRSDKLVVFSELKKQGPFVLYLSPERVQKPGFAEWLKKQRVAMFAIDEAHCVSQWGPDFREDYHKLSILRQLKPGVSILALTATATPEVLRDIAKQLGLNKPDSHVYGFYRPNLYYQVENCTDDHEKLGFLMQAMRQTPKGRVLIYCGTRKKTEEISAILAPHFKGVGYYHAGMSIDQRRSIQDQMSSGDLRVLAATNAFGMGIDYPDVRLVIHQQMPANIESFYQEMGRAGRDGKPAHCLLLYSKKDKGLQSFFIQQSQAEASVIKRRWNGLNAMTRFAEGGDCRHSGILTYFRDTDRLENCGHCDSCVPNDSMRVRLPEDWHDENLYKPKGKRKPKAQPNLTLTSDEAKHLHDKLKDWRKAFAKEHDIPAFMVFSNKTLVDLANHNPSSLDQLESIYGLGKVKIEAMGQKILNCLQD